MPLSDTLPPEPARPPAAAARAPGARHLAIFMRALPGRGAERVAVLLAAGFAARGVRVDFVLARAEGHFLGALPASVTAVDLGVRSGYAGLRAVPRLGLRDAAHLLAGFASLDVPLVHGAVGPFAAYLRRERPDAVLSLLNHSNLAAVVARDLAGVDTRLVLSVHGHTSSAVARSLRPRLRLQPGLMRRFFPRADAVVAVSDGVARDTAAILGIDPGGVVTIPNPVVVDGVPAGAAEPAGHPWLDDGAVPVVLGAGTLRPVKGFDTLIRAFARARAARPLRLVILGEGPERARLRRLAARLGVAGDVDLPGFVANPHAFMRRAGVFVLSSAFEGFGNVLVEAMACATPVVATDCPGGPAGILGHGRFGPLVGVGDADAMARAIGATLDAPLPGPVLTARAGDFTVDRAAARYLDLLFPA